MRAGEKKALIWFALVLLLWRVFEVGQIEDAFLKFITVGALPWTDKTLSPDQVLLFVATLFSVSLLLIFRKEWVRSFRTRVVTLRQPGVMPLEAVDSKSIILRKQRHRGLRIPMPQLRIRDKKLPELYVPSMMPTIWRVMDWEMKLLAKLCRLLARGYRRTRVIGARSWKYAVIHMIVFWGWLEPQLRAFDKWLEKKAHKNRITSDIIEIVDDCWRTVRLYVRRWTN